MRDIDRNSNEMGSWYPQSKTALLVLFLAVGFQPQLEKAHWAREAIDLETAWLVCHVVLCYHEFLPENLGSSLMSVASKSLSCSKIQLEIPPE